jgi:lipopolysaccharide biosynthesis glycosyltransferase
MQNRIDIALGFDSKYAPHAAAVIASIVRHAEDTELRFVVIHSGITEPIRAKVESLAPNARFEWVEVGDSDLPPFVDRAHFRRSILFRLGLEKLAPADCQRVLYFDSDLVVLADVNELWNVDLGGCAIGAAVDAYIDPVAFATRWQLSPGSAYFNAGVLLIDLEKVRAERLFSAAIEFFKRYERDLEFPDQDALNWVFWGRWKELDAAWNIQRFMTSREFEGNPFKEGRLKDNGLGLVHFAGTEKPWMRGVWHPWAWLYWKNLARTPFINDVAREFGVNFRQLARLRLRWWIKRPRRGLRWIA